MEWLKVRGGGKVVGCENISLYFDRSGEIGGMEVVSGMSLVSGLSNFSW